MGNRNTFRTLALALFLTACCGITYGQPYWDVTVGDPGVTHPYFSWSIYALQVYDDGGGEKLYAGGSFDDFAGIPGTSEIARWDRGSNIWTGLDGGLSDGFVNEMVTFDGGGGSELIVGGVFPGTMSGVPNTANLAKWNGSEWSALGTGISGDLVDALTTWDGPGGNRLYVGGRFNTAGGIYVNGIAAWDGVQWYSMGSGISGTFQPYVGSMMVWDDGSGEKLYVGGRFDSMNGLNTPLIARWDGNTWEQVGDGLINDMYLFGIESMAVYDDGGGDALYVGGQQFHAPGQPVGNVSKWDGVQWTTVGTLESGRCTSLCVFDDGTGPGLYRTGNAYPDLGYFAQLVTGDWEMVGGGITKVPYSSPWPSTHALCVWDNALYIGGFFNRAGGYQGVGGEQCGDIAAWTAPLALSNVYVTLTPIGSTTIPANGGTLNFDIEVENDEPTTTTCDIWTDVTLPGGTVYGPIINVNHTFNPGQIVVRNRDQAVPGNAPAGDYTYNIYSGIYPSTVWFEDSFDFNKTADDNGGAIVSSWDNWGESFDDPVETAENMTPYDCTLSACPNPFNPSTEITFGLPEAGNVKVVVYDVLGREIATLADGFHPAGITAVTFNAEGLSSGIYFYSIETNGFKDVKKMMLVK